MKRVLCPFKCNSTFGVWEVQKHVENHCPFRPKSHEPYYSFNRNEKIDDDSQEMAEMGEKDESESWKSKERMGLSTFVCAQETINSVWERLAKRGLTSFPKQFKAHPIMSDFVEGCVTGKHAKQNSSLLAHLNDLGFLDHNANQRCFQEWGCGKAELTKWIAMDLEKRDLKANNYILIDRKKGKLKMDHVFKENNNYKR